MGGIDNLAGIDFQISYGVFRLVDLISKRTSFVAVQFEELNDEGQDLAIHYSDGSNEIIQVKKRGEAYLWSPSSIRPAIENFITRQRTDCHYTFFSDGSLNADMIAVRAAIEDNRIEDLHDHHLETLCPKIAVRDLRAFLHRIRFHTRQFVSNDPKRPGDALRLECQRLLTQAPFTPLLDVEQVYERLWRIVFDASKAARFLTYDEISDLLGLHEIVQQPSGPPVVARDAIMREWSMRSITSALESAPEVFVYGISGTGKTTIVAQALSTMEDPFFWFTISCATTSRDIRQSLSIFLEHIGVREHSELLRRSDLSDVDAIKTIMEQSRLLFVFDATEKSPLSLSEMFTDIVKKPDNYRCSRLLFVGQELPLWHATSSAATSTTVAIHVAGLTYDEFIQYMTFPSYNAAKDDLDWFFTQTGGLPIAASLLKASISKSTDENDASAIFKYNAESIQTFLFSSVFSRLSKSERDFVEVASMFEDVFTIDEANVILDMPLKSLSMVRGLTLTGIVMQLSSGFQIHDSIRPLAYGMLLPNASRCVPSEIGAVLSRANGETWSSF